MQVFDFLRGVCAILGVAGCIFDVKGECFGRFGEKGGFVWEWKLGV